MENYCILKQPQNPTTKPKIKIIPKSKLASIRKNHATNNAEAVDNPENKNTNFDVLKVRRNEKDALLFTFNNAYKSFDE